MVSAPLVLALVVLAVTILGVLMYGMRRPTPTTAPAKKIKAKRPVTAPPPATTAPPPATTAPPPRLEQYPLYSMSAFDYYGNVIAPLPPPPPPGWYISTNMPSFQLVPGAAWPFLHGRHKDDAIAWLLTTYPALRVRVIPYGSMISYEMRNDRISVQYDPYTQRVINARIG